MRPLCSEPFCPEFGVVRHEGRLVCENHAPPVGGKSCDDGVTPIQPRSPEAIAALFDGQEHISQRRYSPPKEPPKKNRGGMPGMRIVATMGNTVRVFASRNEAAQGLGCDPDTVTRYLRLRRPIRGWRVKILKGKL